MYMLNVNFQLQVEIFKMVCKIQASLKFLNWFKNFVCLICLLQGYIETLKTMELPEDLIGKDKIVFGNIHQIFDFHRE